MPDPQGPQPTPPPPEQSPGAFRLFKALGVTVYLHWSWFLVIVFLVMSAVQQNTFRFANPLPWCAVLYAALFTIVLMHEFGHSLACRSVGGRADRIILWPLGGIAFVQPPQRPGAVLWSIVAGPLVNVALAPVTVGIWMLLDSVAPGTDAAKAAGFIAVMNGVLLIFNMLPIYPLDGGQTLQALLWFVIGRVNSLRVAAGIGIVCAVAGGVAAIIIQDVWLVVIALFVGMQAFRGLMVARGLAQLERRGYQVEG
jgi:Zn-dependent protease